MNLVTEESIAPKAPYALLGLTQIAKWLGVSAAWVREHVTYKQPPSSCEGRKTIPFPTRRCGRVFQLWTL